MDINIETYTIHWHSGDAEGEMNFQIKNDFEARKHAQKFARRRATKNLILVNFEDRTNFAQEDILLAIPAL